METIIFYLILSIFINKKIAQELGITIPESVLKEAGQVIE
ncbi:ABC transporter substrate-binding protein [Streptococcus pneumoniae]|nr:ABC transporter substrate-binding protein [Streptococcus pneumoniae]CIW29573.1 ABC transporter substrate-binding protein [Streptococcus pneumoniae]